MASMQLRLTFLALFLVSIVSASPVVLNATSLGSSFSGSEIYVCNRHSPSLRLSIDSCTEALRHLPHLTDFGYFHTHPPNDEWHLPKISYYGDCEIAVQPHTKDRVRGTWYEVQAQVRVLMHMCAALPKPAALTWGGWTTAGEGTGVKITVKKMGSLEASVLSEGLLEREIKKDEMSSGGSLFVDLA